MPGNEQQIRLSRGDLRAIDTAIRALQIAEKKRAGQASDIKVRAKDLRFNPADDEDEVLINVDPQLVTAAVEATLYVAVATIKVYKAWKSGVVGPDAVVPIDESFQYEGQYSLEQLIEARHELQKAYFEAGG
ncbi:hypothetical protein ACIP9X_14505 [Arthrobacter sp. NPDC093125]|uniref:hypothetical protein n=1 Tax=Arthrobacter sp. NPDC093125 TaxID=3363944 RepID=UPI0037FE348A